MSLGFALPLSALVGFVAASIVFAVLRRRDQLNGVFLLLAVSAIGLTGVLSAAAANSISAGQTTTGDVLCFAATVIGALPPFWNFAKR